METLMILIAATGLGSPVIEAIPFGTPELCEEAKEEIITSTNPRWVKENTIIVCVLAKEADE